MLCLLSSQKSIHFNASNRFFQFACQNGLYDLVVFIWSLHPDVDISADNEHAFKLACAYGHLKIVELIVYLHPDIDMDIDEYAAFYSACMEQRLNVAHWFRARGGKRYQFMLDWDYDTGEDSEDEFACKSRDKCILECFVKTKVPFLADVPRYTHCVKEKCAICLNETANVQTDCRHNFCRECIEASIKVRVECPCCRREIDALHPLLLVQQ